MLKQARHTTSRTNPEPCGDFTYTYQVPGDAEPRVQPDPQPGTMVRLKGKPSWADVVESTHDLLLAGFYTELDGAYERAELDGNHVLIRQSVGPMEWVTRSDVIDCDYMEDVGWYFRERENE